MKNIIKKSFVCAFAALATLVASAFDTPYLTFRSSASFSLSGSSSRWSSGTLDIATSNPTDEASWTKGWTGSYTSAVQTDGQYYIYLRGKGITAFSNAYSSSAPISLSATQNVYCEGDIETLRGYDGDVPAMGANCYRCMFYNWSRLASAPTLSATVLADNCYNNMFYFCTALTAAPALPAETLATGCYQKMFYYCTALTSAPSLPATTLATSCYEQMFYNCTSLKAIPALNSTVVASSCYKNMFQNCTSLEVNTDGPGVEWSIPGAVGSGASSWNNNMFLNTSGSFKGSPEAGTTYKVASALPFGEMYHVAGAGNLGFVFSGSSSTWNLSTTVKNGAAPYTFEHTGGTLPPGLEISGSTLSGTPTTPGTYNFTLKVTDSDSHVWNDAQYSLLVIQRTVVPVTFINAAGASITTNCVELNTEITTWDEEWYVATGTLNYGTGGIKVQGDVNLVLADSATLTVQGAYDKAGVRVSSGNSLTIYGQNEGTGVLNATGNNNGAGIGGEKNENCGTVTINGGTIIAAGGSGYVYGAGIGGGYYGNGGTVIINGGTVTATGAHYGAGIGGGYDGDGGTVTINGGNVTASSSYSGAGIGGGNDGNGGTVLINGGTVTATGGSSSENTSQGANGIGKGASYSSKTPGTLTVGPAVSVKAGSTANPTTEIGRGGSVTIGNQRYFYVETLSLTQVENTLASYAGETKEWNLAETVVGGATPYTFSGTVPSGLTLNSNGTLSGAVASAGSYPFTLTVTDGAEDSKNFTYTLTVSDPDPIAATQSNLTATVNKPASISLADTVSGGVSPYTFALKSGSNAPSGFELINGIISGTSTAVVDSYSFTVVVTDAVGTEQEITYTFSVVEASGFVDDDPEEPASGVTVDCRAADGKIHQRTCNLITDSASAVTWSDSWYYVTGNVTLSAGVTVNGKVSLVLGDGATLTISSSTSGDAGIKVIVDGSVTNTLTIYGQSAGTGTLNVSGAYEGAGIGSTTVNNEQCGKITINGGNIIAHGDTYAAGIGGGGTYGKGGLIVINGGTVMATTAGSASGIGGGWNGPGGDVVINGGSVTATGGSSSYAGIGGNSGKDQGTLKVGANVVVKADTSTPLSDDDIRTPNASGYIDLTTVRRYYFVETVGPTPLTQTANAFAAYVGQAFEQALAATVSGGTPSYTFVQKSGTLPTGLSFENGTISGTPTAGGSATVVFTVTDSGVGSDNQSEDFSYTITVTQPPKSITYIDSRDGTTELTGLVPAQYTPGTAATLPATATAPIGYNFAGWYTTAECTGDAVTTVSAAETENKTYYAKWTPIIYTVTYMTDSTTPITDQGLEPTSYTVESATLTLPASATKAGYGFYGWYTDSACSGSAVTTIPSGSTGNKIFYAKWGEVKVSTPYVDAAGNAMPEQLCAVVTSETTTLNTGWYVVNGNVSRDASITVSGDVNLILADGAHLEVTVASGYSSALNVASGNSLTIYAQSNGTGRLDATGASSISSGIGGNSGQVCGTIIINGGRIVATGGTGIGGAYQKAGGTVTINGGVVTATGTGGAGIGGGTGSPAGAGGTLTINGGTVTATGGYSGAGVGGGAASVDQGTLTVGSKVVVKAGSSANPTSVLNPNIETDLTSLLTGQRYFTFETVVLAQAETELAAYAGEAFELSLSDTISGGVPAYSFSGLTPNNLGLTLTSGGLLSGTLAAGVYNLSLTVTDTELDSINAIYTLTVSNSPKSITYKDGTDAIDGLSPTQYTPGTATALAASASKTGYNFAGWYDNDGLDGDPITTVPASETENKTYWAKWTPIVYTVTYMTDTTTPISDQGLTPTSYTIESATLTLPATATKAGYGFYGWFVDSACTGSAVTTIPTGSTGNKVFYAKWGVAKSMESYVDASGNAMPQVECEAISSETTTLGTGWYVAKGEVSVNHTITVDGDAKLILADNCSMSVTGSSSKAGICVAVDGSVTNSLTIYCQSAGTGILIATGNGGGAGIGGNDRGGSTGTGLADCGKVTVYGGVIEATGGTSGGAGIGGGDWGGSGGTVTIYNGTVTAVANSNYASGIGGGYQSVGGVVAIYGGHVTANSKTASYAGIGGNSGHDQGSLTVGPGVVVKAGSNETLTDSDIQNPNGETVISLATLYRYYDIGLAGIAPLTQQTSVFAAHVGEAFNQSLSTTVSGGTPTYTFAQKSGTLPDGLSFNEGVISGTPTAAGSATVVFTVTDSGVGDDNQSADFTYTITVTYPPMTITYKDGNVTIDGLSPTEYTPGTATALAASATKTGYTFAGWYGNSELAGDPVTEIDTEATGNKTFYAKWTVVEYTITYMDGSTTLTGLAPTSYTIEAAETLPTPNEKEGYTFAGWRDNAGLTGDEVTGIALGSTGNKTFYAKWTRNPGVPVEVTFVGADGSTQTETCVALTTDDTELTGWYVVDGDLNFGTSGLTVVGAAHIVLLNGSSLTIQKNSSDNLPAIGVSPGNSLSIYGEAGDTGTLTVRGAYNAAGIGGGNNGDCGTVTINGGTIVATSYSGGAGIGGGRYGAGGTVAINGGKMTATGAVGTPGIGGGDGSSSHGTLTVGEYVTVSAGTDSVSTEVKTPDVNGSITLSGEHYYKAVCDRPVSVSYRDVDGTDKIAACKLVTAATTTLDGNVSAWYAVIEDINISKTVAVANNVNLILADGVTLSVTAPSKAGIEVYEGRSLTIYAQAGGTGTLNATGGSGGGAGTGGYSDYNMGAVTINGGVVNATGGSSSAGIGGGSWGNGGTVTINGGTVTATGGSASAAGIGKGAYGSNGSLTVGAGMRVMAGSSADPTTVLNPNGETSITLGGERYYVVARPVLSQKGEAQFAAYAGEAFEISLADTIEGGTTPYTFSGLTPDNLGLTLTSGGVLSGTLANGIYNLALTVTDSATTAITANYTLTVSLRPKTITYMDGEDELTGLEPAEYVEGTGATLPATATKTGYTFAGWYGNPELTGEPVTTIGTEATGNQTFWAKWTAVEYTITYMDGSTTLTGLSPATYTIEAAANLPTPSEKEGYIFAGWRDNAGLTGSEVTTIPAGSTGNKTFYGKWTRIPGVPMAVTFIDADRTERTETCYVITEEETELGSGWYAIDGTLNFGTGGITVSGDVHLVLQDGSSMTVTGDSSAYTPGIKVLPGYSLAIYGESGGTGTLTANGGNFAAGIGGGINDACGTVTINGGRVVATGGSNAAGIGGGWKNIGGGETSGNGGTVTINGGTVTANGGYACPGIGGGDGSSNHGTLTVGARVVVKAGSSENPIAVLDHGVNGAITLSGQRYFFIERIGPENLAQTVNAFAAQVGVAFNQALSATVSGGISPYSFTLKSETLPEGLAFNEGAISGTPTASGSESVVFTVTDSGVGTDNQSADFTYTITVTYPTRSITYIDSRDGTTELTGLEPTQYDPGTAVALPATASAPNGYTFAGWYDDSECTGEAVTTIAATETVSKTFYAKWTPIVYTVTYMTDSTTPITDQGLVPTSYTIESADLTLPATATKTGKGFYGWYVDSACTGSAVTTIPHGSTGNKVFFAKWGAEQSNEAYVDAYGNAMPAQLCTVIASDTTTLETGWYVVKGEVSINAAVAVSGNVNLILADGAHLTVNATDLYYAAINVTGGNSLTIYGQALGTGVIEATAGYLSAGIGGNFYTPASGTIIINGGTVTATTTSGGAGIGGGYSSNNYGSGTGGTITINCGTVTAIGQGAGIGGGSGTPAGAGGSVTINGGTVTATGSSGAGIGGGSSTVDQGTLTVGAYVVVKAGTQSILTDSDIKNPNGETSIPLTTMYQYYQVNKVGPSPLVQETSALAAQVGVAFNKSLADTVSGGISPYSFTLKSGNLPDGLSFNDGAISGTPTATASETVVITVGDSAIGYDHQSEDFTYTVTVTYPPRAITYIDSRDGTTELTGLEPMQYTPGTAATLPATATAPTGYEFAGWYTTAECTGEAVTTIAVTETEVKTFYAKWTPIVYTVTYMDGSTPITDQGLTPTSYTIESADLTLPATATKTGKGFYGWYDNAVCTGSAVTTIPHGSTGDKVFYAKWGAVQSNEGYVNAIGIAMPEQLCTVIDSDTTTLATGWYVAKGDVAINASVTVSGDVNLILADGAHLEVTAPTSGSKSALNVASGNSLTIYSQANCTGRLDATGASTISSGIGGNSGQVCGTITINGGTIVATGGTGIGSGYNIGSVAGGTVIINGGSVTATGASDYSAGIGSCKSTDNQGALTVGANVVVKAGTSSTLTDSNIKNPNGETSIPLTTIYRYYQVERVGPSQLTQGTSAFAAQVGVAFNAALADTVSGGTSPYAFTLKTGTLPDGLAFDAGVISGTPTTAGPETVVFTVTDSGVGFDSRSADFTYTISVTYPPRSITYKNGSDTIDGLSPTQYTPGTAIALPATATAPDGYEFDGWYDNDGLTGDAVTEVPTSAMEDLTFYAKWVPIEYTITYRDGSSTINGLEPTTYTIESADITLPTTATKEGYEFVSWHTNYGLTPESLVTTIPHGSTGNKTFFSKWSVIPVNESYKDGSGSTVYVDCSPLDSTMTSLSSGWYVVKGNVAINSTVTVTGDVKLILADGCSLTVNGTTTANTYKAGINVAAGNSLTIYAQENGTGSLTATGGNNGAGIGGNESQTCGSVTIYGGNITARTLNTSTYGAGIGGGKDGAGGTVTIYGGTVVAQVQLSTGRGAGIGGGGSLTAGASNGGTVTIYGGTVTATATNNGAGIGGGSYGNGGTVTVYGGTVTATSSYYGAGIGGGQSGAGGNVTINGGTVTATAGSVTSSTTGYIPSGIGKGYGAVNSYGYGTLTVGANMKAYVGVSANPTAELGTNKSYRYYVVKAAPLAQSVSALEAGAGEECNIDLATTVTGGNGTYTFAIKEGSSLPDGLAINGTTLSGTVSAVDEYTFTLVVTDTTEPTPQTMDAAYTLTVVAPGFIDDDPAEPTTGEMVSVDCRNADGVVRKRTCHPVTSSNTAVTWENSWYYVTGDVTLSAGVTVVGKVSLVLADGATLTVTQNGNADNAGINVSVENSLVIYGQTEGTGSLNASASTAASAYGAGIGGNKGASSNTTGKCGTIIIYGGNITAQGSYYGAGIGGGYYGVGGTVTIYGGTVTATGGSYGSGIGGGYCRAGGTVNVYGGEITATCGSTSSYAVGIGRGGGSSGVGNGSLYVYTSDVAVKAGSSSTASLATLTPNTTTRQVSISNNSYDYVFIGVVPLRQKHSSLDPTKTGKQDYWLLTNEVDGMPPYTFEFDDNYSHPEGLSLTSEGNLSGRVSPAGEYTLHVTVTDSTFASIDAVFTLNVTDPAPITVSNADFGNKAKGTNFYQNLNQLVSGGISSYTYSSAGSVLPPGLSLSQDGLLSGTLLTPGDYAFTITITDSALPANVMPVEFTISVKDVYSITYYDGENTLSLDPATYVQDAGVATLPTPTKEGYAFLSWHDNAGLYGAPVTSIPSTSTGPVELYSKWYVPVTGDIEVTFNGADGEQTETCTVITPSMADTSAVDSNSSLITLSSGWYVVANIDSLPQKVSIQINGEVNLVLMDDRSLTVTRPANKNSYAMAGVVLLPGNTLNIYGQTKGTGTLSANGYSSSAGIGGYGYSGMHDSGDLRVYGGTVIAIGASGAAGIGGCGGNSSLSKGGDGGTVEIYGGTVTATGSNGGAGIGGGDNYAGGYAGCGGTVKIYGGTVTAIGSGNSDRAGAGIGGGGSNGTYANIEDHGGRGGTVEIYNGNVTAIGGAVDDVHAAGIGAGSGDDDEGTLKVSGEYALVYAGANAESKTERTPDANDMIALDGSNYFEIQGEGAAPVTCNITYMSAGEPQYWLEPNNYTQGTAETLATPDPREGYTFDGWYEDDQFTGEAVVEVPASATGDKTFYAKWTAVAYTITYYNQVGDEKTEITGLVPATYTTESGATLPTEISVVREGWVFDGWCSYVSGPQITEIAAGTLGDKTFYARWDVADFGLFDGELDSPDAGEAGEWDLTDTIHKGTAPYTFALKEGSSLPDGLVLDADGTLHGTATAAGNYTFTLTVTDSSEPQKTIDAVYTLDVYFHKETSSIYGEDARIPVGYQANVNLQAAISGGTAPYTFEEVEETPLTPGLRLQGNYLRGTPTVTGNSHFFLKVTDANDLSFYLYYWVYVYGDSISPTSMLRHTTVNGVEWTHVSATDSGSKSSRMTLWNDWQSAIPTNTAGHVFVPYKFSGGSYPPSYVCCVGVGVFSNCTEITRVTLPPYLEAIGENAFFGCSSLKEVAMLAPVEQIDAGAFAGTALETVYVRVGDADEIRSLLAASGCNTDGIAIVECEPRTLTLDPNLGSLDQCEFTVPANATVGGLPVPVRENYAFEGWFTEREGGDEVAEDTVISGDTTYYARWTSTLPPPEFTVNDAGELTSVNLNGNTEITLPDTVRSITTGLRGKADILRVTIPNSVTNIANRAFSQCYGLTEIAIPGSVEYIGTEAFYQCTNMVSLMIGDGVRVIDQYAFSYCTSLDNGGETLYIPDSVETIGYYAFNNIALDSVSLPGALYSEGAPLNAYFVHKSTGVKSTTVTYRTDQPVFRMYGTRLTSVQLNGNTEVTIPSSVTDIGSSAFQDLGELVGVTIPSSVTNIGVFAFQNCTNLTSITIPSSVVVIGGFAFQGCTSLEEIEIPDSVVSMDNAFQDCPALKRVVLGDGLTEIAPYTFMDCTSLTNVVFGDNLSVIGNTAFEGCTALTDVVFPDSLTRINYYAFRNCTSITELVIPENVFVDFDVFTGCTSLTDLTVKSGVSLESFSFNDCTSLSQATLEDRITVANHVFKGCSKLANVTIGKGAVLVQFAFSGCTGLKSVNISGTVVSPKKRLLAASGRTRLLAAAEPDPEATSVGNYAFYGCRGLESALIGSKVNEIGCGAFGGCTKLRDITVEPGNTSYETVEGMLLTANSTKLISGAGDDKGVTVPEGVTEIEEGAFAGFGNITSVTLPNTVTTIGKAAFSNCTALATITIPSSVTSIGSKAFCDTAIKTVCVSSGDGTRMSGLVAGTGYNTEGVTFFDLAAAVPSVEKPLEEAKNGIPNWQNYVLGQDGDTPVKVEGVSAATESSVTVASTLKTPTASTGFTVSYSVDTVSADGAVVSEGTKQDTASFSIDLESITTNAFFKMTATIKNDDTGAEVPVETENVIGVLAITNAPKTTVIGVPFKSLSDDGSIAVADLVHTANLSNGAKLSAFDSSGNLHSWTLEGGEWTADEVIGQQEQTGDADTIKLDRGKGVWLTRADEDLNKPIYLIGEASDESVETALETPDNENETAWTLVASPSVEPVDVADIVGNNTGDRIILPTDGIPRNFSYKDGEWGYDGNEEPEEIAPGIIGVRPKRITGDNKIPAGRGFWYLNKDTGSKSINW